MNRAYTLNIASQLYEFDDQNAPKIMKKRQRESSSGKNHWRLGGKEAIQDANGLGIENNSAVSLDLQNALMSRNKQALSYNFGDILLSFSPCIKRRGILSSKKL